MREIKFRAWNSVLNEYRKLDMNSGKQNLGMGFEVMGGINSNITTIYHSVGDVIEQYTGLKDKKGVDIYEGDIVQYGEDRDFIFVVIFKYGCFYAHNLLGEKFMTDSILGSLVMPEKVSVIGNIHENAELLEGQS